MNKKDSVGNSNFGNSNLMQKTISKSQKMYLEPPKQKQEDDLFKLVHGEQIYEPKVLTSNKYFDNKYYAKLSSMKLNTEELEEWKKRYENLSLRYQNHLNEMRMNKIKHQK